jgi:hypothetical protein
MSLGVVRDLRSPRALETAEDARDYQEHLLAEYVLARAAHGVLDATIRQDVAIDEFLSWAAVWAWEVEPRHADKFLGDTLRGWAVATRRRKATSIHSFYRFLEVRYRGEIRLACKGIQLFFADMRGVITTTSRCSTQPP